MAINYRKRYLVAFLWAVVLGVLFGFIGRAEAEADDEIVVKPIATGVCDLLEPYSAPWYFFYCDLRREGLTGETVRYGVDGDEVVSEVVRTYRDGAVEQHTGRRMPMPGRVR